MNFSYSIEELKNKIIDTMWKEIKDCKKYGWWEDELGKENGTWKSWRWGGWAVWKNMSKGLERMWKGRWKNFFEKVQFRL